MLYPRFDTQLFPAQEQVFLFYVGSYAPLNTETWRKAVSHHLYKKKGTAKEAKERRELSIVDFWRDISFGMFSVPKQTQKLCCYVLCCSHAMPVSNSPPSSPIFSKHICIYVFAFPLVLLYVSPGKITNANKRACNSHFLLIYLQRAMSLLNFGVARSPQSFW